MLSKEGSAGDFVARRGLWESGWKIGHTWKNGKMAGCFGL
jgi:hypothetical protein